MRDNRIGKLSPGAFGAVIFARIFWRAHILKSAGRISGK
jgi:hypothetical protein